ncbi:flagellar biosynthesis protein FlhF [Thermomonas sp.]|jgi:flagellar biosynthesis protein FlhF|uniref:flagellar biosynthesis protein FlhF n=1 Tax=Thermomonas sp. TaxID=1971895 RepID=UPI00257DF3A2|nr:flagellar biosynthesis protein FlhF [Thermomonas sp.]
MRIKRFIAPDMRTALRMVRDEQGPDAVILSSRQAAEGGVEVVAATDYDEALVQQTLRTMNVPTLAAEAPARTPPARAVFRIDGVEVAALEKAAPPERQSSRLEQMMAAFKPARAPAAAATSPALALPEPAAAAKAPRIDVRIDDEQTDQPVDFAQALRRATAPPAPAEVAPAPVANVPIQAPVATPAPQAPATIDASPTLRVIETDPAVSALRAELAAMRKVIEREMGQFASERLRGSPARAAALDALAAFGCDDSLAQRIAQRLDPTLPTEAILAPLREALAAELPVAAEELLERGGIVALLGPTGAGKTTTIAKLAARYAARHGTRDVALVSADNERAGAREQLHVLGRRLGVTVCDADGPEALAHALEQLADYPLVLVDTAGYGLRDRALLRQILWVRAASNVRSLLVLPANAHPADLGELLRRYRPAAPEAVILTKLDESIRPGAALSVLVQHNLPMAYTTSGQRVPEDIELADAEQLASTLDFPRRDSAASPHQDEGRHASA